jgi:ATP-dependent DNA helicase DinG
MVPPIPLPRLRNPFLSPTCSDHGRFPESWTMQRYFGPEGLLSTKIPTFEFRASQEEMAREVFDCLTGGTPLLVEAGTGTGKTWAYLIPAILSGKKTIVSTGTKTLQDQILDHDIPVLKRVISPRLQAVCLKGRKNYLCLRRFKDFTYQPTFWNREEAKSFHRFQSWATRTKTGDRSEIPWLPDHYQFWNEVSSSSDQCLGQKCEDQPHCFLSQIRGQASRADLVVVNHHLFFADLALRKRGAGVLPHYDAVIFDEAHQLEDIVGVYFGLQFSNLRLSELVHDLDRYCLKELKNAANLQGIRNIARQLEVLGRQLHHQFQRLHKSSGRYPLDLDRVGPEFPVIPQQTVGALEQLSALLSPSVDQHPIGESLINRSLEAASAIQEILEQRNASLVYWYEVNQHAVFLHGTPVRIDSILQEEIFAKTPASVFTSATLSVGGAFTFFRDALGVPPESKEKVLSSPFSFERQSLLYIPSQFPEPQDPRFCSQLSREALEILMKSEGRALLLFTSYRNMNEVHQELRDHLPFPVLMQGQKPKRILLAEFKEKVDSVLLATSSFWQGVDVPGEALSCLLIDKLPFEVPDDPLIAARMDHLYRQGKNPFFHYQVPRAIIQLKQGVGRLIRSSQDRGVIAIFDVRLLTKSYGQMFLKSLPPCRVVHEREQIGTFFSRGPAPDCPGGRGTSS